MALGRQGERQADLMLSWAELPRSPGHAFYDRLQAVLIAAGFDGFAEGECAPYYASKRGRPSLPPGRYFRMHLVGYFEGIDSERGLEWRCADSLSLREFLRLGTTEPAPDHSWLSKTRSRLPVAVHEAVFAWVLRRLAEHGLIKGNRIGVDASTTEADAALRAIVRRETGEGSGWPAPTIAAASPARGGGAPPRTSSRSASGARTSRGRWPGRPPGRCTGRLAAPSRLPRRAPAPSGSAPACRGGARPRCRRRRPAGARLPRTSLRSAPAARAWPGPRSAPPGSAGAPP